MAIRYVMTENRLRKGSYYARVIRGERVGLNQMINNILTKTSLSASDVQGVVLALKDEITDILLAGNTAVLDGIASFNLTLRGSFDSPNVVVTNSNTQLNFNVTVEQPIIKRVSQEAVFSRQAITIKMPIITTFRDVATNLSDQYTAGSIVRFRGQNMKFNPQETDQGVFFSDGSQEKRLSIYSIINDNRIDALIPSDMIGNQKITIRTRYTTGGNLRSGHYQREIIAAA